MCVDGSPAFLRKLLLTLSDETDTISEEVLELKLIVQLVHTIFPEETLEEIAVKMCKYKTWDAKLNALIEFTKSAKLSMNETFLRNFSIGLYHRALSALQYPIDNESRISAPITLVRGSEAAVQDIDEYYELTKYTKGPVNLKYIDGNHQTVLENVALIDIINGIK